MTAFTDFLATPTDVARWGNWLAELSPVDPGGSPETLYFSSHRDGYRTLATDSPADQLYERRLLSGLRLKASIFKDGLIGGASLPTEAEIELDNSDGGLDQYAPNQGYLWGGRQCVIRFIRGIGRPSQRAYMAHADARAWTFEMGEPRVGLTTVKIPLYGKEKLFGQKLQRRVYRGTGLCLDFAAGAYGSCGTPTKFDITGDLTISGWFNVDNVSANRHGFGWFDGTRAPFWWRINSSGQFVFQYTHGGGTTATHTVTTVTIATGEWYHFAVSVSGTAITVYLYRESTATETVATFTQAAATRDAQVGSTFQISRNSGGQSWVGREDELRVWNTASTASEIRQRRFGEIEIIPTALVGYWKLNDASPSTTAVDIGTGTAATATLNGTYIWMPSLEGDASLAGRVKPSGWGKFEFREAVLVDAANLIYQAIADPGSGIGGVHEGLNALTSGGADIANEKTFITTSVSAGTYRTHLAKMLVKLGSTPTLPITVSGYGATTGLGYADTRAGIVRQIVTTRGEEPLADPGDLDTASFTALGSADDALVGYWTDQDVTIAEALNVIMAPGYWWGYDIGGTKFTVRQWTGPAASADHAFDQRHILMPSGDPKIEPLENSIRAWRVAVLYGLMREHSEDEISATVKTTAALQHLYQRGRNPGGWSRAPFADEDVLADYPRSQDLTFETALQYPDPAVSLLRPQGRGAATVEAVRIGELLSSGYDPYRLTTNLSGLAAVLDETVSLEMVIRRAGRLGLDGTGRFAILEIEFRPEDGEVEMIVWGGVP